METFDISVHTVPQSVHSLVGLIGFIANFELFTKGGGAGVRSERTRRALMMEVRVRVKTYKKQMIRSTGQSREGIKTKKRAHCVRRFQSWILFYRHDDDSQ